MKTKEKVSFGERIRIFQGWIMTFIILLYKILKAVFLELKSLIYKYGIHAILLIIIALPIYLVTENRSVADELVALSKIIVPWLASILILIIFKDTVSAILKSFAHSIKDCDSKKTISCDEYKS